MIWGVTLWLLADWGLVQYRVGILTLLLSLTAGFFLLQTVREPARQPA